MGKYAAILKYNSNHDPNSGRFVSGPGGRKMTLDTPRNRRLGKWLDSVITGARPKRNQGTPRVSTFGFNQVLRGPSAYQ